MWVGCVLRACGAYRRDLVWSCGVKLGEACLLFARSDVRNDLFSYLLATALSQHPLPHPNVHTARLCPTPKQRNTVLPWQG